MTLNRLLTVLSLVLLSTQLSFSQSYFPPRGEWETRTPQSQGLKATELQKAVEFAQDNEYSGSKDLRVAILEGFRRSFEPLYSLSSANSTAFCRRQ